MRSLNGSAHATVGAPRQPWYARLILALQRRKYGTELESARLWARLPRAFLMLTLLYRSLDRRGSPLEPGLRALVQVRVSQINWCAFCVDLNGAAALERAVAPDKLAALPDYARSGLYSGREKAALAYAEAVTDSARRVDESLRQALRGYFGEQEILELTALIAFQNMSSKFNAALGVPSQGFCALPSPASDTERH
ncbi:MAG TPA: carboxymuconolactone decarboxylase family protein [Burkholderiales bacterium]|nr:carboxymuconolactone decarboxylase family protein [Burkholderiales bacterium]